jgi:hypothetical protein
LFPRSEKENTHDINHWGVIDECVYK